MKTFFTLLLSILALAVSAQAPHPNLLSLWVIGGNGDDEVGSLVTKTFDGGFIVGIATNSSTGTGNVDSFCNTGGDRSIFLKYNSDASTLEWSKCFLSNGDSSIGYIYPTIDEGYILAGGFNSTTGEGFFIGKQNSVGDIVWMHPYSKGSGASLQDIIATSDGGYLMLGETTNTDTNFTVHYGSFTNADIGVLKVDSLGNKEWSTVLGGSGNQFCGAAVEGPNNTYYIIGGTASDDYSCTGNHGDSSGSYDMYVARLDNTGNIIWHHDLGGTGDDGGDWGWPDGNGGVLVAGSSASSNGDVTHQVDTAGFSMWVVDLDSSSNIVWNNTYGGGGEEFPYSICRAVDGTIWMAGNSTIKGGEVDTAYGSSDAWIVHADSVGNFLDAKVLGSNAQDNGYMVYPLSGGGVIAGGYYSDSGGAFPDIYFGGADAFLTVWSPWPEAVTQLTNVYNDVKIFPNPTNDAVTIEAARTSDYTILIKDVMGRIVCNADLTDRTQIKVNDWQRGVYFVQTTNRDGFSNVQKLIVQ